MKAGWRYVPIHRELAQTMTRLIEDSGDGYVLSGLTVNKYGDRSNAVLEAHLCLVGGHDAVIGGG